MKLITALAVVTASISTVASAQTERDLGSHEHGSAVLNIVLDNGSVFIELDTPWNNLVGFEHAPRTDEQHALVDEALAQLNQPETLFSFNGATCNPAETTLENTIAAEQEHDEHGHDEDDEDHDAEEGHGHDEDHAEAEHDSKEEHGHDEDHAAKDENHDSEAEHGHDEDHEAEADSHASLLALYSFSCDELKRLSSIDVKLLEIWSGFESLEVQLVGTGGQALVELNQQQWQVDITQIQ